MSLEAYQVHVTCQPRTTTSTLTLPRTSSHYVSWLTDKFLTFQGGQNHALVRNYWKFPFFAIVFLKIKCLFRRDKGNDTQFWNTARLGLEASRTQHQLSNGLLGSRPFHCSCDPYYKECLKKTFGMSRTVCVQKPNHKQLYCATVADNSSSYRLFYLFIYCYTWRGWNMLMAWRGAIAAVCVLFLHRGMISVHKVKRVK